MPTHVFVHLCAFALLLTSALPSTAGECDIGGIVSGYGANGPYTSTRDSVVSPLWGRQHVDVFMPAEEGGPWPTVVFLHTYGADDPEEYDALIHHIVSRGYAVVYPPVRKITFTRKQVYKYRMAFEGIDTAFTVFRNVLDTARLGFVGHGFGGGMTPSSARTLLKRPGWGTRAFVYIMAPWYAYGIDQRGLESFPTHVKLVVQAYEHDRTNDMRIAQDLFDNIGIPKSEKDFSILMSHRHNGCLLLANNNVPLSDKAFGGEVNALDYYGVYRTFDGLAAYAFEDEWRGRNAALGGGHPDQTYMGVWSDGTPVHPAVITDTPADHVGDAVYANMWISPRNPRADATNMRRARKVFSRHIRKKFRAVASTVKGKLRKRRFEEETDDTYLGNPIADGFGADGTYGWQMDSLDNPRDSDTKVYVFMPDSVDGTVPVLFLIPGYSGPDPYLFFPFIPHVVSRGMAVVFSPYPILPAVSNERQVMEKLEISWAGIQAAVELYRGRLDTSRVGVMGQSFGGGLAPALAYRLFTDMGWGSTGAFMFLTAPWYCYGLTDEQLKGFPEHVKLVTMVFDDDRINDHEIAVDLYSNIGVPPSEKDYVTVYSDSAFGSIIAANHFVPYGETNVYGSVDLLDYYAVYRMFDALAEASCYASEEARVIALGNGAEQQVRMGEIAEGKRYRDLGVTDTPKAEHTQFLYLWAWDNRMNPRRGKILDIGRDRADNQPQPEQETVDDTQEPGERD